MPNGNRQLSPDEIFEAIGDCGRHLSAIGACEGAAGNISVLLPTAMTESFTELSEREVAATPFECPALAGRSLLVTGSGSRLRDIHRNPSASLARVEILPGGQEMRVFSSPRRLFSKPTSEFNTHLAIHARFGLADDTLHSVIHAQPLHLTYLSHLPAYGDTRAMNSHIMRWQPETLVFLPQGLGVLPFILPGSPQLQEATLHEMETHAVVMWSKHGVIARSSGSIEKAADLIEYLETAARYESLNLTHPNPAPGLSPDDLRSICHSYGIDVPAFLS